MEVEFISFAAYKLEIEISFDVKNKVGVRGVIRLLRLNKKIRF